MSNQSRKRGFFSSLRGHHPDHIGDPIASASDEPSDTYTPPSGPPPSYEQCHPRSAPSSLDHSRYALLEGHSISLEPNRSALDGLYSGEPVYAAPPGPPPSQREAPDEPAPYHDWTIIPDTALLPPPPSLGHKKSPMSNAKLSDADRAHAWCNRYPLIQPHLPAKSHTDIVKGGDLSLVKPSEYLGNLSLVSKGLWRGSTRSASKDACVITSLPLYFASTHFPLRTKVSKTIYFEVKISALSHGIDGEVSSMAVGFCAVPYPSWRMPGWERGSLAVHADDGRRYVNDTYGGKDFTTPIKAGETVGIGMTFAMPETPPDYDQSPFKRSPLKAEVFFTRNGQPRGGWNVHEELDATDEFGALGLDGQYDLYGAIGTFGEVAFEANFNSKNWLWQPNQ